MDVYPMESEDYPPDPPLRIPDPPYGRVVSAAQSLTRPRKVGVLEMFCVDVSKSMQRSQTFPFIFGTSKLETAVELIGRGWPTTPEWDSLETEHWSSLVVFSGVPVQIIPFQLHTDDQKKNIIETLSSIEHSNGTAIYSAIKLCEDLICSWRQQRDERDDFKVLLHIFTDGIDNSSDANSKAELDAEQDVIRRSGVDPLKHTFLYSFSSDFHSAKEVGTKLNATVIMVNSENTNSAIELRDKSVFKSMAENPRPPVSKALQEGAFSILEGDQPELSFLHRQLHKALLVFTGDFLKEEGIFRQNASLKDVNVSVHNILHGKDTLEDYESPIQVAHSLKNILRRYNIIPKQSQHELANVFTEEISEDLVVHIVPIISQIAEVNKKCLSILLEILHRTVKAQESLPKEKALGLQGLATVFSGILFSEVVNPDPNLVESPAEVLQRVRVCTTAMMYLVEHRSEFLPPPTSR
eukprot:TRINITY_DN5731_c0_g1_i1.p1 TRINITY_DN5731_c0_g1~~TRINITY_DN5731_c0_g1_i1.p1  ORF type:complete len:467 (-),score=59.42 TRINITY_DN5731_c0_g1_i1:133-1533(-)